MSDGMLCGVSKLRTTLFGKQIKTDYYISGKKKSKATYRNNIICSEKTWHQNGKKRSKCTFKDGGLHGNEFWWHDNGEKQYKVRYHNNVTCGIELHWHSNGNLRMQIPHDEIGQIDGEVKHWHPNGVISYVSQYSENQKHGFEKSWDCTYILIEEDWYIFGELVAKHDYRKFVLVEQLSGIGH